MLQVLLCCRCLDFAPHPRIVDDPCSNVSAIGTVTVCVILILIVETSEGCCTGSKRRWRLVQGGRGGSTKKLFAFLWKIWKLLRRRKRKSETSARYISYKQQKWGWTVKLSGRSDFVLQPLKAFCEPTHDLRLECNATDMKQQANGRLSSSRQLLIIDSSTYWFLKIFSNMFQENYLLNLSIC